MSTTDAATVSAFASARLQPAGPHVSPIAIE
jgi:hypothetical protein